MPATTSLDPAKTARMEAVASFKPAWCERRIDTLAAGAALCAAPLSIAVSELFLGAALAARLIYLVRDHNGIHPPRVFWWWIAWAGLEIVSWLQSPQMPAGLGEVRHLVLLAGLFLILPALDRVESRMAVWRGIFITSTFGSASVIFGFLKQAIRYHHEIAAGGDPAFYLRTGGLLHHWMIYSTVEVLVFGALLEFGSNYPAHRRWTMPALAIHVVAIGMSLTRALWLACFLLLSAHLILRRSKGIWALVLAPATAFLLAPGPFRTRISESLQRDYYSNAERAQMWEVGWRMIRERPFTGVGAGRVAQLYTSYLSPGAPVPAYHGHLHNNALQLAAQFGLPVLLAAQRSWERPDSC